MIRFKKEWPEGILLTTPFLFLVVCVLAFAEILWAKIVMILVYGVVVCLTCLELRPKLRRRNQRARSAIAPNPDRGAGGVRRVNQRNAVLRTGNRQPGSRGRIARRIVRPAILFHGVPNPPRKVAGRRFDLVEMEIVEQKPQIRETTWNVGRLDKRLVKRELSFPFVVFTILFFQGLLDSLFAFYRNSPSNGSGQTRLYPTNLCNVAENGRVCLGRGIEDLRSQISRVNRERKIDLIVNHFWYESAFDLNHLTEANFLPWAQIEPQLSSLEEWEKSSLRKPPFILSINWARRGISVTIEELLNPFYDKGG